MEEFQSKFSQLSGTNFAEVCKNAFGLYQKIKNRTKRKPYVRSVFFNKQKIFLDLFWHHLHEKLNHRDKVRRVKLFPCAIDLIKNSKINPISKESAENKCEILHRFSGKTKNGEYFCVQIKENKKNGHKWFISVFPVD